MGIPATDRFSRFKLKGWHVLAILLVFFGIIFVVAGIFFYTATTTLRGLDRSNAYERGLAYEKDVIAAREQTERQWNVDIALSPDVDGSHKVTVSALDKEKQALAGLKAEMHLDYPTDSKRDMTVVLSETTPGIFTGKLSAEKGRWYLHLRLSRNGEVLFRSKNSITLE